MTANQKIAPSKKKSITVDNFAVNIKTTTNHLFIYLFIHISRANPGPSLTQQHQPVLAVASGA
jgi:predicted FMN-binding regulatory protein PaiB